MSTDSKIDVCNYHLCQNKTRVYRCKYCDNYFCKKHIEPKMVSSLSKITSKKWDKQVENEWRKENAHPCADYSDWLKISEKEKLNKSWEALNELRRIEPFGTPEPEYEYSEGVPVPKGRIKIKKDGVKIKIPIKYIIFILILGFIGWYFYSNPELIQNFTKFSDFLSSSTTTSIPPVTQEVKYTTVEIPYIKNFIENVTYFPSEYQGKIDESSIGSPITELIQQGWKIGYKDIPEHKTTQQRITVKIKTIEIITTTTTIKTTTSSNFWLKISEFFSKFSIWKTLNCTDGTFYSQCSADKPYYCFNGTLIKNSTFCGCPYDYKIKGNDCEKIQRCNDRTIYGECSSQKPYYCSNGDLVKKASFCGCPMDEIAQGDDCVSKFQVGPKEIQLYYGMEHITYTVYKGLNDYLANLPRSITYYENPPTTKDFIMIKLDNEEQKKMLDPLVDEIKKITTDRDNQAKIAIMMVQLIHYDYSSFISNNVTGKYPYEVLYTYSGVCSEKAYLLAYLLRGLGYGTAILEFTSENHDAVGIKCPSQYNYKNTGYCFVEAAGLTAIGDSSEYYVGVEQLTSNPEVIVISDGYALSSIW